MLQTKCKISKFRQVSINRTCNQIFSVAIKKPRYGVALLRDDTQFFRSLKKAEGTSQKGI